MIFQQVVSNVKNCLYYFIIENTRILPKKFSRLYINPIEKLTNLSNNEMFFP